MPFNIYEALRLLRMLRKQDKTELIYKIYGKQHKNLQLNMNRISKQTKINIKN